MYHILRNNCLKLLNTPIRTIHIKPDKYLINQYLVDKNININKNINIKQITNEKNNKIQEDDNLIITKKIIKNKKSNNKTENTDQNPLIEFIHMISQLFSLI